VVGALPGGITSSIDSTTVPGQIILTLTGTSTIANYRTAIQQVRYSNNSENPAAADRILQVTVNDGLLDSAVATATITVTAVNDPPNGANDIVLTNVASGANFSIALSALLANDADPEGSPVTITAVGNASGLSNPSLGASAVTVSDTGGAGGSFNYFASDGSVTDPTTTVNVTRVTGATITGTGASEIIVGDGGATTINGGGGNDHVDGGDGNDQITAGVGDDIVQAGTGNDTIIWNANAGDPTDGFDMVDGGAGATDTFVVNGRGGTAETFRIYAREAAITAGIPVSGANTEIVITRTVGLTTTVVAELDNIEEIRVNAQQVTSPGGTPPGGNTTNSGDAIQVIGNFNGTSLNFNTITIDGTAGDDTVDITSLQSAHRIVFRSNGGNDTIVGTLRANDVIELPRGKTLADYSEETDEQGVTTLTCGDHQITYTCSEPPVVRECTAEEPPVEEPPVEQPPIQQPPVQQPPAEQPSVVVPVDEIEWGGRGHDRLWGQTGNDKLYGGSGNDRLWGQDGHDRLDGGAGQDRLYGAAGDDKLYGRSGNDRLDGGLGNDRLWGQDGHDTMKGNAGDDHLDGGKGKDRLSGGSGSDKLHGGSGDDRLDGGAGRDRLIGGAGDDRLTGGSGHDVFVFQTGGGWDTVTDFRNGHDKIDARSLSGVNSMSDLVLMQSDNGVEIAHGSDILVLKGVNVSDLDNSDFIF
jgi:Ca2+-binding RTX toxin-like protein